MARRDMPAGRRNLQCRVERADYDQSFPASEESAMTSERRAARQPFTTEQARAIGDTLGIDWSHIELEQFRMGMNVELEHGVRDPATDVTGDDAVLTGKIALAHLNEFPDYYTRLKQMEREADEEWRLRKAER